MQPRAGAGGGGGRVEERLRLGLQRSSVLIGSIRHRGDTAAGLQLKKTFSLSSKREELERLGPVAATVPASHQCGPDFSSSLESAYLDQGSHDLPWFL